jgi:hypothetical protein
MNAVENRERNLEDHRTEKVNKAPRDVVLDAQIA